MFKVTKKALFLASVFTLLSGMFSNVFAIDYLKQVGFSTLNGGTTGGEGGVVSTVSTYAELEPLLTDKVKRVIYVNGEINAGEKGAQIRVESNKSIIGVGTKAFFNGVGLAMYSTKNVIFRNLRMTMTGMTYRKDGEESAIYDYNGDEGRPQIKVNDGDCIHIEGSSSNAWIDHCDFSNEDPHVQTNQDLYDGLVDIKSTSQYFTLSWNYFHDHHKGCLIGSSEKDLTDRKITYHHNKFYNLKERVPSYRGGTLHSFNNFFENKSNSEGSGINVREGAKVLAEGNYFKNYQKPICTKDYKIEIGYWQLNDNVFDNCKSAPTSSTTSGMTMPYDYKDVLESSANTIATVEKYCGVGKLDVTPEKTAPVTAMTSPAARTEYDLGSTISLAASATDADGTVSSVTFYAKLDGATDIITIGTDNSASYTASWKPTAVGTYVVYTKAIDNDKLEGVSDLAYKLVVLDPNANKSPVVDITSPKSGDTFKTGDNVTISATATDADGSIAKVEFFNGTTSLGTSTSSPYSYTWKNVYMGNYSLKVTATDNEGGTTTAEYSLTVADSATPIVPDFEHNFTTQGVTSSFLTIVGNLSTSKGTVTYGSLTLTQCLKMESATSITFTTTEAKQLTLVFNADFNGNVKIDGVNQSVVNGIAIITLSAGNHEITKGDSSNLYYLSTTDVPTTANTFEDTYVKELKVFPNPMTKNGTIVYNSDKDGEHSLKLLKGSSVIGARDLNGSKGSITWSTFNVNVHGIYTVILYCDGVEVAKKNIYLAK